MWLEHYCAMDHWIGGRNYDVQQEHDPCSMELMGVH